MKLFHFLLITMAFLSACIGTDIIEDAVEPKVRIQNIKSVLEIGETHQFQGAYFDISGSMQAADFIWSSSNQDAITIDDNGLAEAKSKGMTDITAMANGISATITIAAIDPDDDDGEEPDGMTPDNQRTANLRTVSTYPLEGTATLTNATGELMINLSEDFQTTSALPGLYIYLTNNNNSINNAIEIGAVTKFSGAQSYTVPGDTNLDTYNFILFYCKPFSVPVGDGEFIP